MTYDDKIDAMRQAERSAALCDHERLNILLHGVGFMSKARQAIEDKRNAERLEAYWLRRTITRRLDKDIRSIAGVQGNE